MSDLHDVPIAEVTVSTLRVERRRPGRIESVSPHLLPLLRDGAARSPDHGEHQQNDLTPVVGIAIGVLISIPIWALIVWVTWRVSLLVTAG